MQNYKLKQKIIKTKPVTYYRATHSNSTQFYIIKKLNKSHTWQDILQSKSLTLCKNTKSKHIAKIKQIIKQQNSFYCIMQNSDINLTEIIKNDIQRKDIYKISKQLIQVINGLFQQNIIIRDIRPAHLFINQNKNNIKLYHFQTISEKDLTQLDLTELQDLRYIAPEEVLTKKGSTEKSLIFSIGLIISQLILGQPLLNAKNKLQYIYQLTNLFPADRVDKMKGSQHEFKQPQQSRKGNKTFQQKMNQQLQIGIAFISLTQRMLKIDYSQRISISQLIQQIDRAIQEQQKFHKNKQQLNKQNSLVNLPNKNQVNIQNQMIHQISFDFQNKSTLSSIPVIFNQKNKGSAVLPEEENVQDDGNQPIIIKQASSNRNSQMRSNLPLKKGTIQKVNQNNSQNLNPKSISNLNVFLNTKPSSIPPIFSSQSPAHILLHHNSHPSAQLFRGNDQMYRASQISRGNQLKNSRSTKQATTLNTIKKPQLTNYAMNEANLGLKVGMNNTLFSQNNYQEQEFM